MAWRIPQAFVVACELVQAKIVTDGNFEETEIVNDGTLDVFEFLSIEMPT